ncbi:MAG: TlpA family protein disulfide reductase [Candidatus Pacebacteria bacterium]|nr:TlpA family protein disulfide reductase [Candidatus Paceibacterota bacterium]
MPIRQFIISISILLMSAFAFTQPTSAADLVTFSSKDFQGNLHTVEQYRGKWIIVNYWGIFCGPCLREMPELSIFHDQHKDKDAVVLGINQEDLPDKVMARFADKMKISFPLLNVPFEEATPFGRVTVLPTTFIINPQGELVAKQQGAITMHVLEDYIKRKKQKAMQEKFSKTQTLGKG